MNPDDLDRMFQAQAEEVAARLLEDATTPVDAVLAEYRDGSNRAVGAELQTQLMEWAKDLAIAGFALGVEAHRQCIRVPEPQLEARADATAREMVPDDRAVYAASAVRDHVRGVFVVAWHAAAEHLRKTLRMPRPPRRSKR